MFVDQAKIWVKAGDGGHGCVSFRREKFVPKGGPDGGDGGDGGSVYFVAVDDIDTLTDFLGNHHWQAKNGLPGEGANRKGSDGKDLIVKVPLGTLVYDEDFGILIKDMTTLNEQICICIGGKGGKGNTAFKSSANQAPRFAQEGKTGQQRNLQLELKLIADIGLVGIPNAGKSTLISRCSCARPKIANYPFTTLEPVLGIVELQDYRRFVMADIPGLIEGASDGAGLGHDFLKHIERTRILVHIVDINPIDGTDPAENYAKIRKELEKYSKELASKEEIIVANKTDLDSDGKNLKKLKRQLKSEIIPVSAASGENIKNLTEILWTKIVESKNLL